MCNKCELNLVQINFTENIENLLNPKDVSFIKTIGLPSKVINVDVEFINPIILDDIICFGNSKYYSEIKYGIEFDSGHIVIKGETYNKIFKSIINSSLQKWIISTLIYNNLFLPTIEAEKYGCYDDNYEKYSDMLKDLIKEIDKDALSGAWGALIDEMRLGVI